jgi:hypothetical protein
MTPNEAARLLREEIADALADLGGPAAAACLRAVRPPRDLGPDGCFQITASAGPRPLDFELPSGLAMAYLADEEAAVDEWKRWIVQVWRVLESRGG